MLQQFVRAIQDQSALDRVAEPVQPLLQKAFREQRGGGAAFKNFLSGTWIGHPLHPILKDVPIGAWTMAAIFDALHRDDDSALDRAADISIATGLAGALASAVTGLADWSDTQGHARRVGVVHALLNVCATGCYATSMVLRRGNRAAGVQTAYAGYAIMMLGAYLGGHLVFGQQIGVNHAVEASLPTKFKRLLPADSLTENAPHNADLNGTPLLLVRRGTQIYALLERCSHQGGPLAEGTLEDTSIRCPWHGSRFALENGAVLEGPATMAQPCFETRVVDGWVEVRAFDREAP